MKDCIAKGRHLKYLCLLIIITLLTVAGCSGNNANVTESSGQGEKEIRVVVDCMDREVQVPQQIERIATLYAYTGHVATMLGRGDDIVAIVNGLSRDVLLNEVCPSIGRQAIPYTHDSINIEELIATKPDVVFIKRDVGVNEAEVDKLDKFGIPYVVIDCNNIEEQLRSIEVMGEVLGCQEQAEKFINYYHQCMERVEQGVSKIPENERLRLYHSVNEAARTDADGTLPADWLKKCGVINVSVDEELRLVDGKYFASLEQILLWDPDVIIANEAGVPEYIMSNAQWAPLKAVQTERVYQMPVGLSRWGHPGGLETPLAMLWTVKTVYPEYFTDLNMKKETRTYYKEFFNYELSDEMLQRILTADDMRKAKK